MRAVRFLLALMLMLSIALTASAASLAEQAGYDAFKRLVEKSNEKVDCISKFQLIFHNPYAHGELSARDLELPNEKFDFTQGALDLNVALGGKMINFEAPFYVVEDGKKLEIYFSWLDGWKKLAFDDLPLDEVDKHSVDEKMALVTGAVLLNDVESQQIVRVAFDAEKLADLFKSEEKEPPTEDAKKDKRSERIGQLMREAFLKTGTVNATFSIDKATSLPLMVEMDLTDSLTNVLQAVASDEEAVKNGASELLSSLASTSSLKLYAIFDYSGPFDRKKYQLPKDVKKAKDITQDLLAMAKTESTKTR